MKSRQFEFLSNDITNGRVYYLEIRTRTIYFVKQIKSTHELYHCDHMGRPIYHDKILMTDRFLRQRRKTHNDARRV